MKREYIVCTDTAEVIAPAALTTEEIADQYFGNMDGRRPIMEGHYSDIETARAALERLKPECKSYRYTAGGKRKAKCYIAFIGEEEIYTENEDGEERTEAGDIWDFYAEPVAD